MELSTILKVGDARRIRLRNEPMIIQEIMMDTGMDMDWKWDRGICPHCNRHIEDTRNHKFGRVEILVKEGTEPEQATIRDVVVFGVDQNGKFILFTSEKAKEAYGKSEKFKHLTEV